MIMICTVIGDLTEKPAQHNDYGHIGQKKQFFLHPSRQLRNWGHQSTPPSLGQHNRLIVKFKSTLDCNWSWRHVSTVYPLQDFCHENSCWAFAEWKRTGANTPPLPLRQFWRFEHLAAPRSLQQQTTRH